MLIRKCKWYWPVILSLVAFSIHSSAIVLTLAFLMIILSIKFSFSKKTIYRLIALSLPICFIIIHNIQSIFSSLANDVESFGQYTVYDEVMHVGGGWFNYIFYGYLAAVILFPLINRTKDEFFRNTAVILYMFGFIFAISGYYIGSYRLNYYTYTLFLVVFPIFFFDTCNYDKKVSKITSPQFQRASWLLFLIYTGFDTLMGATSPSSLSDIYEYSMFNPF